MLWKKIRVRRIKSAGLGGLILHCVVREGLTCNMALEGSEEANHEATLGREFQAGREVLRP